MITSTMTILYPESILGYHTNFGVIQSVGALFKRLIAAYWPSAVGVPPEHEWMTRDFWGLHKETLIETGYLHIQVRFGIMNKTFSSAISLNFWLCQILTR